MERVVARGDFSLRAFGFRVVFEGAHEPRSEDRLAKPPTKGRWKSTRSGLTETYHVSGPVQTSVPRHPR